MVCPARRWQRSRRNQAPAWRNSKGKPAIRKRASQAETKAGRRIRDEDLPAPRKPAGPTDARGHRREAPPIPPGQAWHPLPPASLSRHRRARQRGPLERETEPQGRALNFPEQSPSRLHSHSTRRRPARSTRCPGECILSSEMQWDVPAVSKCSQSIDG